MTNKYVHIVEGMLFLSGNIGITISEIVLTLNIDHNYALQVLEVVTQKYNTDSGLKIIHTTNTYKLVTKSEYYDYYKKYANLNNETFLGKSTLEVLAIIAYKQPITKYEVEQIKGSNITYHLTQLLNKNLIYVSGRLSEIGNPNIFSTTENFLDFIGINFLDNLPDLKTFKFNDNKDKSLLDFDIFDFKQLSEQLLNSNNTFEVKYLDKDVLEEIEDIKNIKIDNNVLPDSTIE